MLLYLVRHGEATAAEHNPARPLSDAGRKQVESLARKTKEAGLHPARILHSGKLRARETAEILAEALVPGEIRAIEGLSPDDEPDSAAELAQASEEDLMLVGHLPHVGRVAAALTRGAEPSFSTAELIALKRNGSGKWTVASRLRGESQ